MSKSPYMVLEWIIITDNCPEMSKNLSSDGIVMYEI